MVVINHRISIAAGALASSAAIEESGPINLRNEFDMESLQLWVSCRGFTVDQGPVWFGIHDADYDMTEVAEYYTAGGPLSPSAKIAIERSQRNIMPLGLKDPGRAASIIWGSRGQQGHIYQKWDSAYGEDSGPAFHIFNDDDAALTTGGLISGFSRLKGKWI